MVSVLLSIHCYPLFYEAGMKSEYHPPTFGHELLKGNLFTYRSSTVTQALFRLHKTPS